MASGIAILAATSYMEVRADVLPSKEFWVNMQYFGYDTIPVALLLTVLQYMGIQKWFTIKRLCTLFFVPVVTILLLWTNDYHHLMRYGTCIENSGGLNFLGQTYGLWCWINMVYLFTLILVSLTLLIRSFIHSTSFYRRPLILLISGVALPTVFSFLYIFHHGPALRMDFSPAISCLGCALIALAILRFRLFEIKPVAYDLVIHSVRDGVLILDENNLVVDVNDACEKILGIAESEVIGARLDSAFSSCPELVGMLNIDGSHDRKEVEIMHRGHRKYLEVQVSSLTSRNGRSLGKLAIITDITERRQREDELKAAKIELEKALTNAEKLADEAKSANAAKSQFLANMSHEIRTPLNGVIGMMGLLLDTDLDKTQREYAELAETSSTALFEIVNDILDFSKIEAGKLDLELVDFSLHAAVRSVGDMLSGKVREKGISYSSQIAPEIPSNLHGDEVRLRQVLVNLVGNAVKFTESGGVAVQVFLDSRNESTMILRFEVTDIGIGISPEKIETLFNPFSQEDGSISRRFGGTGLGLAISSELVSVMGGDIGVDSRKGEGSTFWFTSTFRTVDESFDANTSDRNETFDLYGCRILLAEDNAVNQKLAVVLLEKMGCVVDVAHNGVEAVHALSSGPYDLVLMDMQMPEMDGFEATRIIRDATSGVMNHDIPIIAMTAMAVKDDREECLAAGMNGYISKPVDPRLLAFAVRKHAPAHIK